MHLVETGPPGAPTILLLHAAATSGWMWEPVVARLGRFHCLVPDLPGHGGSARLPWTSLDATADALADLVARRGTGGRAHVVGLSLGAYGGLALLARHPARVDRALLSGVNVLPFPHPRLMRLMGYAMLPLMKRGFLLRAQARALRIPPDREAGYRAAARALSLRAFLRLGEELLAFRPDPALARSASPALVVAGEREQSLIRRSIPELLKVLPGSQGRLVPGLGHGWSGEDPELFARTVAAWCGGREVPGELIRVG